MLSTCGLKLASVRQVLSHTDPDHGGPKLPMVETTTELAAGFAHSGPAAFISGGHAPHEPGFG
jgi:hypothetical protein